MSKNIVVIPVRGGSKRLPGKNIRPIRGLPLLAHSILFAKLFPNIVDEIYVSTDDKNIKDVALEYGAKVIDRPQELAGDLVPTLPVLKDVILQIGADNVENVILLQATNPLRAKDLLTRAWEIYKDPNLTLKSLFTVSRSTSKLGKIIDNKFIPWNYQYGQRSQDLEPLYFENGALYISHKDNILNDILIDCDAYPMVLSELTLDIDTIEEFEHAEFIFEKLDVSYKKD